MNKESLRKLTIQELEGQLIAVKEQFRNASSNLAIERQQQLAKTKVIRGGGKKRKKELIEQILKIQRETQRVEAKIEQIKIRNSMTFNSKINIGKIMVNFDKNSSDPSGAEMWAAIKTYKDNVKRGVIQEKNNYDSLQSEEQVDYAFETMSQKDFTKYLKLANEKAAELEAASEARAKDYASGAYFAREYVGF